MIQTVATMSEVIEVAAINLAKNIQPPTKEELTERAALIASMIEPGSEVETALKDAGREPVQAIMETIALVTYVTKGRQVVGTMAAQWQKDYAAKTYAPEVMVKHAAAVVTIARELSKVINQGGENVEAHSIVQAACEVWERIAEAEAERAKDGYSDEFLALTLDIVKAIEGYVGQPENAPAS